jgi:hypothetical protein
MEAQPARVRVQRVQPARVRVQRAQPARVRVRQVQQVPRAQVLPPAPGRHQRRAPAGRAVAKSAVAHSTAGPEAQACQPSPEAPQERMPARWRRQVRQGW